MPGAGSDRMFCLQLHPANGMISLPAARVPAEADLQAGRKEIMSDLARFREGHKKDYETALREVKSGRKRSHWMWYIFPQIHGLGFSGTSQYYAIRSLQEAGDFLADPVLGAHTRTLCEALLSLDTNDPWQVFGSPDDKKLSSSMTLFALADPKDPLFQKVLDKYYGGERDERTIRILREDGEEIA